MEKYARRGPTPLHRKHKTPPVWMKTVELLQENPTLTYDEIAELIDRTRATVILHVQAARKNGINIPDRRTRPREKGKLKGFTLFFETDHYSIRLVHDECRTELEPELVDLAQAVVIAEDHLGKCKALS